MKLPQLLKIDTKEETINVFGGYNHNLRISEGEFFQTKNLTSDDYPLISPRASRGIFADGINPQGMIGKDGLCYVDGECVVIGGYKINLSLSCDKDKCPKKLVSMGAYIVVFPDKKYINTKNFEDFGSLEGEYSAGGKNVRFLLSRGDGSAYGNISFSETAPASPDNMDLWIDSAGGKNVLKQYSEYSEEWVAITSTFIRIEAEGIGLQFNEGDGISISDIKNSAISALNGATIINSKGDDFIVVSGILDGVIEEESVMTVRRVVPDLDFVIENDNRLWGCRYGLNADGKFVNEIYASKQGDFKNWNCFSGISTDSYVVSCGTGGKFTGAISYSGYPLFFKEHHIHKILGYSPSSYQLSTMQCNGVQDGSGESLAIISGLLFYKSPTDICVYSGSLPEEISKPLGNEHYRRATAGGYKGKYYISMQNTAHVKHWSVPTVTEHRLFVSQILTAEVSELSRLYIDKWSEPLMKGETLSISQIYEDTNISSISRKAKNGDELLYGFEKSKKLTFVFDDSEEESWNLFVFDLERKIWMKEDNTRAEAFCSDGEELFFIEKGAIKTVSGNGSSDEGKVHWIAETGDIGTDTPNKMYISRINIRLLLSTGSTFNLSIQYDSSGVFEHLGTIQGNGLGTFNLPVKVKRCDHMKLKLEGVGPCKVYSITKTIERGSSI